MHLHLLDKCVILATTCLSSCYDFLHIEHIELCAQQCIKQFFIPCG